MEIDLPDGPTEDSTSRDGLLSYAGEWHALVIGLGTGLAAGATGTWMLAVVVATAALGLEVAKVAGQTPTAGKALGEVRREPWYALGGLSLGAVAGVLLVHGGGDLSALLGWVMVMS